MRPSHPPSSYEACLTVPPVAGPSNPNPSRAGLSQNRRAFSHPILSRLKGFQPSSLSSSLSISPPFQSALGKSYTVPTVSLNDSPPPPPRERLYKERERDRPGEREKDNMSSKMMNFTKRHLHALRRPSPSPVPEDYESASTAMRYGRVEQSLPPPTIEQIARGLASRPLRPKTRSAAPARSALKHPPTTSSPVPSSLTTSSSSSFLPSFSPSLRRLSRASSTTGTTHTTMTTEDQGGSDESSGAGRGRKAVTFGERVMVVERSGRRSSKTST